MCVTGEADIFQMSYSSFLCFKGEVNDSKVLHSSSVVPGWLYVAVQRTAMEISQTPLSTMFRVGWLVFVGVGGTTGTHSCHFYILTLWFTCESQSKNAYFQAYEERPRCLTWNAGLVSPDLAGPYLRNDGVRTTFANLFRKMKLLFGVRSAINNLGP